MEQILIAIISIVIAFFAVVLLARYVRRNQPRTTSDAYAMIARNKVREKKISFVVGLVSLVVAMICAIDLFGPQIFNTGRILTQVNVLSLKLKNVGWLPIRFYQNSVFVKLDKGIFNNQFVANDELVSLSEQSNNPIPVTVLQTPVLQTITVLNVNGKTYYVAFRSQEMYLFGAMLLLGLLNVGSRLWKSLFVKKKSKTSESAEV